jgi:Flp pilus assembly CpaE family ATPase
MNTAKENMDKITDEMNDADTTLRTLVAANDTAVVHLTKTRADFNQTLVQQANDIYVDFEATTNAGSQARNVYEKLKKLMVDRNRWKTNVEAATAALLR